MDIPIRTIIIIIAILAAFGFLANLLEPYMETVMTVVFAIFGIAGVGGVCYLISRLTSITFLQLMIPAGGLVGFFLVLGAVFTYSEKKDGSPIISILLGELLLLCMSSVLPLISRVTYPQIGKIAAYVFLGTISFYLLIVVFGKLGGKTSGFAMSDYFSDAFFELSDTQERLLYLLAAAVFCKFISYAGVTFFDLPSSGLFLIYFVLCIVTQSPSEMAGMSLIAVIALLSMYLVTALIFAAFVLSIVGIFIALLAAFPILIVSGSVILGVIYVIPYGFSLLAIPPAVIAMFTGASVKAAIEKTISTAAATRKHSLFRIPVNVIIFILIGWTGITLGGGFTGVFSFKPAFVAQQAFFRSMNVSYDKKLRKSFDEPFFKSGFYDKYLNNNNNIHADELVASSGDNYAFVMDNVLYVVDSFRQEPETVTIAGYFPDEYDALILSGSRAYIFGDNRILCTQENGSYMYRGEKWADEYEKMSEEEQIQCVYDILVRQSTTENENFSYGEVGMVARSMRKGQLLYYSSETQRAIFGSQKKDGTVELLEKTADVPARHIADFHADYAGNGLGYSVMAGGDYAMFLNENTFNVICLDDEEHLGEIYTTYTQKDEHALRSLNYALLDDEAGEYACLLDDEDKLSLIRLDSARCNEQLVDTGTLQAQLFVRDYYYCIDYDSKNLLRRFTYLLDLADDVKFWKVWGDAWSFKRVHLYDGVI